MILKNVVDACIANKVKKLIYTSSVSVLQSFTDGTLDGKDNYEYVKPPFRAHYMPTKAEAERVHKKFQPK